MTDHPTRYAVLRDRRTWDGVRTVGLRPEKDGVLALATVPGPADGVAIRLPGPFRMEPSGLAIGECGDLVIADATAHRITWIDGVCGTRMIAPECATHAPGGLALGARGALYVADSGGARVQVFRLPGLELSAVWSAGFDEPTAVAVDARERVYVLDRLRVDDVAPRVDEFRARILRFSPFGVADTAYADAVGTWPLASPAFLAVDDDFVLYLASAHIVRRFNHAGKELSPLPHVAGQSPAEPRAIACGEDRVYVADATTGRIWVFDPKAGAYQGTIPGYEGPVAALAVAQTGDLYVKPGPGDAVHRLVANADCMRSGRLEAGPLDAGSESAWARVHVDAEVVDGTSLVFDTFVSSGPSIAPAEADWTRAAALDTLVAPLPGINDSEDKRYLWLRLAFATEDRQASPRVSQVQAETGGDSYLAYLPAIYRKADLPRRFLERWLELFRAQLGDWERELEDVSRRFDPAATPEDWLPWLASCLAWDVLPNQDADDLRRLLARLRDLYDRRGTPEGLREFVALRVGARPHIFEAFRQRRLWQLGVTSALGFDTALAAGLPDGMIVPGVVSIAEEEQGLRGDYYAGTNFRKLVFSRTDPGVDFEWKGASPGAGLASDDYSVRWTGQVRPRYSETYTFHTASDDGVRLWVDGRLIVDDWHDHVPTENSGRIALLSDRWYPITIEYYEKSGNATARLFWSSRNQLKEIVPPSCLYAATEAMVRPDDAPKAADADVVLVGRTVVGESGPLTHSDFGLPLFADEAHLFTVVVPAAAVPDASARRALAQVIEAEKPAHTDFHLCFVQATMRVGFQARIGIDTIVAGPPPPMDLSGTVLGLDSYLDAEQRRGPAGRVGRRAHIGQDTVIG